MTMGTPGVTNTSHLRRGLRVVFALVSVGAISLHHPVRVAGLRVRRTRLTISTHTRPMMGETNRE